MISAGHLEVRAYDTVTNQLLVTCSTLSEKLHCISLTRAVSFFIQSDSEKVYARPTRP
jgi:hypothetical protein